MADREHIPFPDNPHADEDQTRRVAGNLSIPRTVDGLREFIRATDPYVSPNLDFGSVVNVLVQEGFVAALGEKNTADDVLEAVKSNDETPNIHRDEARAYKQRVETGRGARFLGLAGTLYVLTQKGYDALTGPVENEPPPLEGRALEAAHEQDERLAEADAKLAEEDRKAFQESLEQALREVKEAGK